MAKQGGGLETKSGTLALGLKSAVNLPIPSDDSAPMALQGWFTICTALIYTLSCFAIRCPALFALTGALYITMRHYRSKNPYFAFSLSPTLHIVITVTIRIISIFRIYANEIIHSTHATNHRTQLYSRQPKATQLNL